MRKARFITVEGIEGVGKSTHIEFIRAWLETRGINVLQTREPGGTPLAEQIRSLLLDASNVGLPAMSELLLMFAARADHVEKVICPALAKGCWVLCDRFTDASYAYQGGGRKLSVRQIAELENMVLKKLKPDLTLLLDAPVEIGLKRIKARGERDRFELEQRAFFDRVRRAYLKRVRGEPRRISVIKADGNLHEVQQRIAATLKTRLARWL
ncbi:MAG: dTMP kinase [Gammaproteobacteria bacterium]